MAKTVKVDGRVIAGVAGLLALSLILIPVMSPSGGNDSDADISALVGDTDVPQSPAVPAVEADPAGVNTDAGTAEALAVLEAGLASYEEQLLSAGGAQGSFIAAAANVAFDPSDGSNATTSNAGGRSMLVVVRPNGDYRAIIENDPHIPEILHVDSATYVMLSEADQREWGSDGGLLESIGKPDAQWAVPVPEASTAIDTMMVGVNIKSAVIDLAPVLTGLTVTRLDDGTTLVSGRLDRSEVAPAVAESYGFSGSSGATVTFSVDSSGVLQGYVVEPDGAGQPVSLVIRRFYEPRFKTPKDNEVVRLEDVPALTTIG